MNIYQFHFNVSITGSKTTWKEKKNKVASEKEQVCWTALILGSQVTSEAKYLWLFQQEVICLCIGPRHLNLVFNLDCGSRSIRSGTS